MASVQNVAILVLTFCALFSRCLCCGGSSRITSIRLAGRGSNEHQGRVEIKYKEEWGTVCDDDWDINEGHVICRMLGFQRARSVTPSGATFGQGSGKIWLDNTNCIGNETHIELCGHRGWGENDCSHSEDAGVVCDISVPRVTVRLAGNNAKNFKGRVEVNYKGTWGTVCDDGWDISDGHVICRMLGFERAISVTTSANSFGPGRGLIGLSNMRCKGDEDRFQLCRYQGWGIDNCNHNEDAGVVCYTPSVQVRLAGTNSNNYQGRVEVYYGGRWGTVCDDLWDINDGHAVCHQLGYQRARAVTTSAAQFGRGTGPIFLDDVQCSGNEVRIEQCRFKEWETSNCHHGEDAGVVCDTAPVKVRLTGNGANSSQGRVEINYNGTWGTVCDDDWSINDGHVICRMLGFQLAIAVTTSAERFGPGTGSIWLDNTQCTGNENRIELCGHGGWGINNCNHNEDAGVVCYTPYVQVRLAGNNASNYQGRVEVYYGGRWGTVCDDLWDINDGHAVCHQLGYPGARAVTTSAAQFGRGTGPIFLDDVQCSGNEVQIGQCRFKEWETSNCGHGEDAGVVCAPVKVRLTGNGASNSQGRVEINYNGTWGTVCDDDWSINDGHVICSMLGFELAIAVTTSAERFGPGTGSIWLDNTQCTGNESRIELCGHRGWGVNDCNHNEDAGVVCYQPPVSVRLAGIGSNSLQGRIEINYNGTWGTVCDDNWDINGGQVICRMLGFQRAISVTTSANVFGPGTGRIWLDNTQCTGNENRIELCGHRGWGVNDCSHSEDAGVVCYSPVKQVRLAGYNTDHFLGRVEINYNGTWGTVCDDGWDISDGHVICRMLGFKRASAITASAAIFGSGYGRIWLDNVHCDGNETRIELCPHRGWGVSDCKHSEDAGVVCYVPAIQKKG